MSTANTKSDLPSVASSPGHRAWPLIAVVAAVLVNVAWIAFLGYIASKLFS
jgi:hypothetical protein